MTFAPQDVDGSAAAILEVSRHAELRLHPG